MFKKALSLLLVLLLLQTAFSVRLVDPINKELVDNDFVGAVSPGSTLELIITKDFDKFDSLNILSELPASFEISLKNEQESFKVFIKVPKTVSLTDYPLSLQLSGPLLDENVSVYFSVQKGLMDASFDNYSSSSEVGKESSYKVTLVNNSYSNESFSIVPQLPWYWKTNEFVSEFKDVSVIVPKRSTKTFYFSIIPRVQGEKVFNSTIVFGSSGESKTASLKVNALPSIKGKLESVFFGLPFYSFSLIPNYLISGFFSFFF